MAIFKGLIEKAKDRYDLERPSPPPPIPNGIQRPIDPPTEAQVRASIEAEMAQARQQAAQYGMPQRYVDKIFSRDQYTPPPSPPSLPPVMTDTVPERFRPPPPDPRIPPTIISDPREEMGGPLQFMPPPPDPGIPPRMPEVIAPGPGRFGGRSDIYNPTPPTTRTFDSNPQPLGNAMPIQLPQGPVTVKGSDLPVTGGQGFLDSDANRRALQLLHGPFFADDDYGRLEQPPSFFQAPIMQQQYAMQGIGSLPDPEGYTGVRAMAEGGALFDPANYTDVRPMAGDPFRGVPTKMISGPFGEIEVPITYEGDNYGGTGSTFDQLGNVMGPETFAREPGENYNNQSEREIPSIFGPGDTTTTTTTTTTDTTDTTDTTGTTDTPTTGLNPFRDQTLFGPGGGQPQTATNITAPTYPLPASKIYPNVITPVVRDSVFPSYDDPITVKDPFEKPQMIAIGYGPVGNEQTMWIEGDPIRSPVNTIQAPPPSPFSPVPPPSDGDVGILPISVDGGPVPFQQGIGSFVR